MHRIVHLFLSERRLQYICLLFLLGQASFAIGLGSFGIVEGQGNNTNQSTANQETTNVEEILSDACNSAAAGNDTSSTNRSQAQYPLIQQILL